MKEKILHTATDMFLNIGFKSVTMDDIADKMAISKKTIYTYYKNKQTLIEASVYSVFEMITKGINQICILDNNPIAELFIIKDFVLKNLKNEKTSPIFQLKKYYPKLYAQLQKKQLEVMQDCVNQNIEKGIKQGLFTKDLNIDFISRIYFSGINVIKDDDLFPKENTSMEQLMNEFLNYHIRAIATEKGIGELKKQIKTKSL
ncbi:MAG TPA: TetR/AcrR family transcriptional regulator [Flavobacteriia bacterium]|nr:TetR/AcrR family transcriptional regulator [Flavobacteriia bacterium]